MTRLLCTNQLNFCHALRHLLKDFSIVNLIEKRQVLNSQVFWITSIEGTLFNKAQRKEAWIFLSQALGVSLEKSAQELDRCSK